MSQRTFCAYIIILFALWCVLNQNNITEKMRKADLWTIKTVIRVERLKDYKKALNEAGLKYISYKTTWDEYTAVDILSENRSQSKVIKEILEEFNAKYSVHTSRTKL